MSKKEKSERDPLDWYPTPQWALTDIVDQFFRLFLPRFNTKQTIRVLETSCGDGAIIKALLNGGFVSSEITGIDIDPKRLADLKNDDLLSKCNLNLIEADFLSELQLDLKTLGTFDLIIQNPPYSFAQEFIEKSLTLLNPNGYCAVLLRIGFTASKERKEFRKKYKYDLKILSRRINSANSEYVWFVFGPGCGGRFEVIECESGRKKKECFKT